MFYVFNHRKQLIVVSVLCDLITYSMFTPGGLLSALNMSYMTVEPFSFSS